MTLAASTDPMVTVVIPTFNAGLHLCQTLDSVMLQTMASFEVIVVDDGSTDDTVDLVRKRYPMVQIVRQANAGVSAARNHGLSKARGRYVCFLDQDDVWPLQKLERQVQCLEADLQLAAVACPFSFWPPDSNDVYPISSALPDPGLKFATGFERWTYHHFLIDCWALTSATMLRTEVVRACGGFDVSLPYSEDWDLWLRVSRDHGFAMITWPQVLYRQHAVQGSRAVRRVDYRSDLLMHAARAYGLKSADGNGLTERQLRARMALYRAEFGYHHLQHGDRWIGARSLLHAWLLRPMQWRNLALATLALLGWRPHGGGARPGPG